VKNLCCKVVGDAADIPSAANSHRSSKGANHFDEDRRKMPTKVPAIEFDLKGFKCVRYFEPTTGQLCVSGPNGCMDAGLQYSMKYGAMCQLQSLRTFLEQIEAEADMNRKLHAVMHVMEKYKSEIAAGMGVSHDLVIEALDELGPWKFIEPKD
jgi:hypothetical protein